MWTPIPRRQYRRDGLRHETDVTDGEWALIEPLRLSLSGCWSQHWPPLCFGDFTQRRPPVFTDSICEHGASLEIDRPTAYQPQ
jgi:hypothetical protein